MEERYKFLGAEVKNGRVLVECPQLPDEEELRRLKEDIDRLSVRPSELAAWAMAYHPRTKHISKQPQEETSQVQEEIAEESLEGE
jgi:hypothetical protein